MRQLMLVKPGRAEWTEVPDPVLTGPDDALVRPIAVATCDLDTAINAGVFPMELPYAVGHEFVAEVIDVADGVSTIRPGDVVAVPFQISCGRCDACGRGQTQDCRRVPPGAMYGLGALGGDWGGALADTVRVPYADAMLLELPSGIDAATAASMDNLPDAWRTVAPYLDEHVRRVLVVGRQSIGLYAVSIATALGADVTYIDDSPARLAIAERMGATVAERGQQVGTYPVTVSTDATPDGLRFAIDATARGGVCTDTGIFTRDVPLPLRSMFARGITFRTGRPAARTELPAVLDLIASGRLDPSVVTASTASWEDAPAAWSEHAAKLVITR